MANLDRRKAIRRGLTRILTGFIDDTAAHRYRVARVSYAKDRHQFLSDFFGRLENPEDCKPDGNWKVRVVPDEQITSPPANP